MSKQSGIPSVRIVHDKLQTSAEAGSDSRQSANKRYTFQQSLTAPTLTLTASRSDNHTNKTHSGNHTSHPLLRVWLDQALRFLASYSTAQASGAIVFCASLALSASKFRRHSCHAYNTPIYRV